ncbi:MAG: choice-of-anchor D domain-containing protein [Bacteroidales bacterium]|jgi:hypothetical protein|nr:choice-of-anchor D domain-containing protein [Bacteroidales bacterium]
MKHFYRRVLIAAMLPFIWQSAIAQNLKMRFYENTSSAKVVVNGGTCNLGNWGTNPKHLIFHLELKNSLSDNILKITDFKIDDPDSKINLFIPGKSFELKRDELNALTVSYLVDNDISTKTNKITFKTNDPNNKEVVINFVVNPDKGLLSLKHNSVEITSNSVNIGDIPINETRTIDIRYTNIGKGYMKVKAIKDIISNNKLYPSLTKDIIFGNMAYTINTISFKAIKKGVIKSSYIQNIERGTTDKREIKFTGKVLAPVTELSYNSKTINNGDILLMPDNNFEDKVYDIKLRNTGDYKLNITSIFTYGQKELKLLSSHNSTTLAPGEETTVKIQFTPESYGDKSYRITFDTDGYESSRINFNINTKVLAPKLSILNEAGKEYSFQETVNYTYSAGTPFVKKILLKNSGNKLLTIKSIKKLADTDNLFTIKAEKDLTLEPGKISEVSISYFIKNITEPNNSIFLEIESDDHDNKKIKFKVNVKNSFAQLKLYNEGSPLNNNDTYNFDNVSVNKPKTNTIVIQNIGNTDLLINDIKINNNDKGYYSIINKPNNLVIKSGEESPIQIRYSPVKSQGVADKAILEISTNDYKNKTCKLNLTGLAQKPTLQLLKQNEKHIVKNNELNDYGTLKVNEAKELDFTFSNTGNDILEISNFTIESPDGATAKVNRDIDDKIESSKKSHFKIELLCKNPGVNIFTVSFNTNDYENSKFKFQIKADVQEDKTTDISINRSDIVLYPNPVVEELYVKHNLKSKVIINVINTYGTVVHTSAHNEDVIRLHNKFKPGMYIIQIISEKRRYTRRFTVL